MLLNIKPKENLWLLSECMPSRLSQISGKELSHILIRLGFQLKSSKGSHRKFVRKTENEKETVVFADHKTIKKGVLSAILKQISLNIDEFKKLL
jgi:predicted RNA binding protein YcfA (HicA-like mRNA interferase family)